MFIVKSFYFVRVDSQSVDFVRNIGACAFESDVPIFRVSRYLLILPAKNVDVVNDK